MKTSYFTFGQDHVHEMNGFTFDKDVVVKVTATDPVRAMNIVFRGKWSMEYDEPPDLSLYPRGIVDFMKHLGGKMSTVLNELSKGSEHILSGINPFTITIDNAHDANTLFSAMILYASSGNKDASIEMCELLHMYTKTEGSEEAGFKKFAEMAEKKINFKFPRWMPLVYSHLVESAVTNTEKALKEKGKQNAEPGSEEKAD